MIKRNLLITSLLIACVLAYLNSLAFDNYWYWRIWWFDIVMHWFGGIMLGGIGLYFFMNRDESTMPSPLYVLQTALFTGLAIGLLWEFFEFGLDHVAVSGVTLKTVQALQLGMTDTFSDLTLDALGALFAGCIYYLLRLWKQKRLS